MELSKIERKNITPRNGLVAAGVAIAAIAFSGCFDESRVPITIPPDAKERFDAGEDRTFVMDDNPINRELFDCGKTIRRHAIDRDGPDPEFIDIKRTGKILAVCEGVGKETPVNRIAAR